MRIISKFSDYYDSVQKFGQDLSVVYLRQEESLEPKKFRYFKDLLPVFQSHYEYSNGKTLSYIPFIVLVNDRSYVGFRLSYKKDGMIDEVSEYCYDEASCVEFLRKNSVEQFKAYTEKKKGWRSYYYRNSFNETAVSEFFKTKIPGVQQICIENSAPIVMIGKKGFYTKEYDNHTDHTRDFIVIKNPCLKTVEFYKALDTNSTFQEIESFMSGVLPSNTPNMATISEKNKIIKHGFDYKLSFRKAPTKKKGPLA